MVKLAEFAEQTHITAVLRAMVSKNEPSSSIVLWGDTEETRRRIALAFLQALNCHAPINGDSCGICLSCKESPVFSEPAWDYSAERKHIVYQSADNEWVGDCWAIRSVEALSELNFDVVQRSTVFEVKTTASVNPLNLIVETILFQIHQHKTKEFLEQCGDIELTKLLSSITEVLQELLLVQNGLQSFEPTDRSRFLASALKPNEIISALRLTWEASLRPSVPSQTFIALLADTLRPSIFLENYDKATIAPINTIDEEAQSLSLEEMVEIAQM